MSDDIRLFSKGEDQLNYLEIGGKQINIDKLPFYKKYPIIVLGLIFGGAAIIVSFICFLFSIPLIALLMLLTIKEKGK